MTSTQLNETPSNPIREHVELIHRLANGIDGLLVVSVFNASLPKDKGVITHHRPGDIEGMVAAIEAHGSTPHMNIYCGLQVMKRSLGRGQRGTEADVVAVLGLVADMDSDRGFDLQDYPIEPNLVLETSPGNFQPFWLFDRPLPPETAKDIARRLKVTTGSDHGTADIAHIWRVPGTLNWPNKAKIERGRSEEPVPVRVAEPWAGSFTDPAALALAVAGAQVAAKDAVAVELGEIPDVDGVEVSPTAAGLLAADDVGDRSAHASSVVEQLAFDGHPAEVACALFLSASGNWKDRYATEGHARKDFERCWGKFGVPHEEERQRASGLAIRLKAKGKAAPVAANDNNGIRLLSYEEFKAQEHGTADAIINGLVRTGTLIAVGGRPGAGKTALMVAIADTLDKGEPFLGRQTKETTVAYIAAEDGGDVANRLEAIGNTSIKIVKSPDGFPLTNPKRAKEISLQVVRLAKALDPDRHVMLVVDTLRAALGGQSVLDDKYTSPALNALREVAEAEGVVIAVLNHTNRENNKATKGETLEAVTALELVLLDGDGDWHTIYVGKNRSGPPYRNIGRVKYTSVQVGDVTAAIIDEMVADETPASDEPKERKTPDNARLLEGVIRTALLDSSTYLTPYGSEGPRVKAADVAAIREQFYARKAGKPDSKLKAFNRALDYWLRKEWIVRGEYGLEGAIWYASKSEEAGHAYAA